MSNWQQEGGVSEQEDVREDVPEPEDERFEMDPPPAPGHGPQEGAEDASPAAVR
jgi:hypothetical protein